MTETIILAVISAGLASLVNCIFQLINKRIDNKKEEDMYKRNENREYLRKKEEIYAEAIQRLLEIKKGFNYIYLDLIDDYKELEKINKSNDRFLKIAPLIRLYATDEIFDIYYKLESFKKYSYSNGRRLGGDFYIKYDSYITILSKLMQGDLGYRKLNNESMEIICPECEEQHDIYSKCPKCGMTYSDFVKSIINNCEKVQENN